MKVWVLAGLMTAATIPFAAAAESTAECQLDESRRAPVQRVDSNSTNVGAGGGVPTVAQLTTARTTNQTARDVADQAGAPAPAPAATTQQQAQATQQREEQQPRRRNGKRVPDAELIGPRGAL